jgi:hypothetical protein
VNNHMTEHVIHSFNQHSINNSPGPRQLTLGTAR